MSEGESFAPSGLSLRLVADPQFAPWAGFLRRFAASRMRLRDGFRLEAPRWVFGHDLLEAVKNGKSENVITCYQRRRNFLPAGARQCPRLKEKSGAAKAAPDFKS